MKEDSPFDTHAERYEAWFDENEYVYASELRAIRTLLPAGKEGVEVGVGSGRFAVPLGIRMGVEPSKEMRAIARTKGIEVIDGVAESLSFEDERFDVVLMVTTLCFLDDVAASFDEAYRVLRPDGSFIVAFVDRGSPLGADYMSHKEESLFYKTATFYSAHEVMAFYERAGFTDLSYVQTIFCDPKKVRTVEPLEEGHGKGLFLVIRGMKT
jgi:SAM-dependent methyltransferase